MDNLRSNYRVKVESKKQAKQFKQALLALGEPIFECYWDDNLSIEDQNYLIFDGVDWFCVDVGNDIHELITFKELLTLIVNDVELVKPSLLYEKVIIEACDERQLKILMGHYESNGWKAQNGQSPSSIYLQQKDQLTTKKWKYGNDFHGVSFDYEMKGYKIIPFSDFAAEVGLDFPVFVKNSEEGAPIYVGDPYYKVWKLINGWELSSGVSYFTTNDLGNPVRHIESKAFSTKQAAESWIAEQNKPKELECKLFGNKTAYIKQDCIDIDNGEIMFTIYPSDLEDMLHVYKQAYA